jgi:hypothetical protein
VERRAAEPQDRAAKLPILDTVHPSIDRAGCPEGARPGARPTAACARPGQALPDARRSDDQGWQRPR